MEWRQELERGVAGDRDAQELLGRFDAHVDDLVRGVSAVYDVGAVMPTIIELIASTHRARSKELRKRDRERPADWFQSHEALGYVAYADLFNHDLAGVQKKIPYLRDLGVTYFHLMPLLEPRPGENDGGYAVKDYRRVRSDLGTMDDLAALASSLHKDGIALTLDLVLNHVAKEHEWAEKARAGDKKYQKYFYTYPDRTIPDQYEQSLPEVFPDFAPGNFTWDDEVGAWVWTTFNSWQWDVNWSNPDLFCEYLDIIGFLANQGVDCLRLDAIAFIWKRMGTNCQNQSEVHFITQALRAFAKIVMPSMIFKAEAIVGPRDLVHYLGQGEHAGKVSELAYHNSLMVQIWSAMAARDGRLMGVAMSRFPEIPSTTSWATYLRCHDDIGWAIDDADAADVGWNGHLHRRFLSSYYANEFSGSFARGVHFQIDQKTGEGRTSGSAASLIGIEAALQSEEAMETAINRLLCAYAMVFGFGGLPLLYMGDEIALLNDYQYVNDPQKKDDSRWIHRPAMPWDEVKRPTAVAREVFNGMTHLISVRKKLPVLHAGVPSVVFATSNPAVVIFRRERDGKYLLQAYNLSESVQTFEGSALWPLTGKVRDHLSGQKIAIADEIVIGPYGHWWLTS